MYLTLKSLHIGFALLSISGFVLRVAWLWLDSDNLNKKWVKIVPHIADTCLLASAIALMILIGQYPFFNDWLTVKVTALMAYIFLGTIALKRGKTVLQKRLASIAALFVLAYIVTVARSHSPWPF